MPQIEKITYITTIYWIFISYFVFYLDMIVTYLYKFLTSLKLDLKRLALVLKKVLLYKQYKHIIRQWSNYPASESVIMDIFFIILFIDDNNNKKWVNPYPRPKDHDIFLENFYDFDKWLLFFAGHFSPSSWVATIVCLFVLYYSIINPIYNQITLHVFYTPYFSKLQRSGFIFGDLFFCFTSGAILLMGAANIFRHLVESCPVMFSPGIMVLEFSVFFFIMKIRLDLILVDPQLQEEEKIRSEELLFKIWLIQAHIVGIVNVSLAIVLSYLIPKYEAECFVIAIVFMVFMLLCLIIFLRFCYLVSTNKWKGYRRNLFTEIIDEKIKLEREKKLIKDDSAEALSLKLKYFDLESNKAKNINARIVTEEKIADSICEKYHIIRRNSKRSYKNDLKRELDWLENPVSSSTSDAFFPRLVNNLRLKWLRYKKPQLEVKYKDLCVKETGEKK